MKVAYFGDILNHGNTLSTTGTAIVMLLNELESVSSIDVFCPEVDEVPEISFDIAKVDFKRFYKLNDPKSLLSLLLVDWREYNLVVFNILPTVFGKSLLSSFIGMNLPFLIRSTYKARVGVIYHNSTFTNDYKKLGYGRARDVIKAPILRFIEITMLKKVRTFFTLDLYCSTLKSRAPKSKISLFPLKWIEAVTTVYLNKCQNKTDIVAAKSKISSVRILLHGYWGPQKNLGLALEMLSNLKKKKLQFNLAISGEVNSKFEKYKIKYSTLLDSYKEIIDDLVGRVAEKDIFNLFTSTDLLILPYNTPGGHSGVLETAMFFQTDIIAFDFPEFREQARGYENILFCKESNFETVLRQYIENYKSKARLISIREKVQESIESVRKLVFDIVED